ncbi:MAG TPA: chromosome segregation protein SMC [Dehalococcoidia bacterium]|nr:chromosome segregation protein SMC [Dehalococcoidia bacterium]
MLYLKRLDISGFKSFATRTSFYFSEGITAIVGPNGSGKSNVADALRWVLGEQSGRLIRARKVEDVLFAGSAQKTQAEKAEVTIFLDNSSRRLPINSPEVSISRRAYRSGESDYFINRKKVRLRDVQDLLLAGNASQSSYSIIGQGLVESVLNLKLEERRQLIEEAADIQRYRQRIDSAEMKLVATHENIERVELLVKEITPRLRQLERQAKRAQEHAQLTRELSQALQVWYEQLWQQAQETLILSRSAHDQAQAEQTQTKVALETCQRELSAIADDLEQRRVRIAQLSSEGQQLKDQVQEQEQRLSLDRQRQDILLSRQRDLSEELRALEGERERAAGNVLDDSAQRGELEREIEKAQEEVKAQKKRLSELENEFQGARARAGAAEEKAVRLRSAAEDLKSRAERLGTSQGDLGKEGGRLQTRKRSLINQLAENVRVLKGVTLQSDSIAQELEALAEQRSQLQQEAQQISKAIVNLEANQRLRQAKLESLRARLQIVEEAHAQYRSAMARSSDQDSEIDVEGFLAAMHEIIRVPRGMETAVEAALADYLDAVIVERQQDAILTAKAIIASGSERTILLPWDSFKSAYPLNILKEKGILGVASRLVKCEARYQSVVDTILGRTIIVQDTDIAVRVARRGIGTVVTLDGIVFHASGAISAGWASVSRPAFVLSYERDLEALPKDVEKTQRSLALTERELASLRQQREGAEDKLKAAERDLETAQGRRLHLLSTIAERRQRLAYLRGELRGVMAALFRLQEQEDQFQVEATRLLAERERLLTEAQDAEELAAYLRKALDVVEEQRTKILNAITEASSRGATLEGELRSLAGLRQQQQEAIVRLDARLAAKRLQLQGLQMELSALASSLLTTERELKEARTRLESQAVDLQPEQEVIAQSEARERELRSQLMTLQNRLLQSERKALEAEAAVRRWNLELETLRQHIQDDGLEISDDGFVRATDQGATPIPYWLASRPGDQGEGPRPIAGSAIIDPQELGSKIEKLRAQLRQLGPVNMEAQADYQELEERHSFLSGQLEDLAKAEESLRRAINDLNTLINKRFETTFAQVSEAFTTYFKTFFGDGDARLALTDGQNGVDIIARPTGKRVKSLAQLSGGEKALTAVSFLFALLQTNPAPFCVLDEVDAMLDEANVERFVSALQKLSQRTQFILISHNRKTIEKADSIYGISMGADTTSKVLSLRLSQLPVA